MKFQPQLRCPNEPPCPHWLHDIEDLDDPRPTCVEEACPCGKTALIVQDSPKMIREALCVAQAALSRLSVGLIGENGVKSWGNERNYSELLQHLIDECDRHRPLGPDGKHGQRHTPTCGCEDR